MSPYLSLFATLLVGVALTAAEAAGQAGAAESAAPSREELAGRPVVVITGSTGGLGREVAKRVASLGAHVVVHGRDRERGMEVVQEIRREGKGSATFYAADFASLEQVRQFAETILRDYPRIDVLINNAGIYSKEPQRRLSADGHEMHFAVNYLSGYLLTHTLLPRLRESAPARIINVSSGAQRPLDFDDVMLERDYSGTRAYAQSKLAQILFTFDLARELQGSGVTVNALHPATYMDTEMVRELGVTPRSSVDDGADAVMSLVIGDAAGSGQYFNGQRPTRAPAQAYDEAARERLRALSRELTGI